MSRWDVVVIGAGPAGCTAALYAAQGGVSVLLLEREAAGGQMTRSADIDNWPGEPAPVDGLTLGERMQKHAVRCGAALRYGTVTALSPEEAGYALHLSDGIQGTQEQLHARHVILATGARPRMLGLPGEAELWGRGLSCCAACDGRLYRDKAVVVVGGGATAVHDALYLARICRSVTLVHRRESFKAPAGLVEKLRALANVKLLVPYQVTAYTVADGRVAGVILGNTRLAVGNAELPLEAGVAAVTIGCDGVFLAVGTIPEPGPGRGLVELDEAGAIVVDARCRTSLPGVYAIGDCRAGAERQIVHACGDGAVAARTILASS